MLEEIRAEMVRVYAEIEEIHAEPLAMLRSAGWFVRETIPSCKSPVVASYGSDAQKVMFDFYANGSVSLTVEFRRSHFLSFELAWKALNRHVEFWRNLPLQMTDESPTLIDNEIPTEG